MSLKGPSDGMKGTADYIPFTQMPMDSATPNAIASQNTSAITEAKHCQSQKRRHGNSKPRRPRKLKLDDDEEEIIKQEERIEFQKIVDNLLPNVDVNMIKPLPECDGKYNISDIDDPILRSMVILLQYQSFKSYVNYSEDEEKQREQIIAQKQKRFELMKKKRAIRREKRKFFKLKKTCMRGNSEISSFMLSPLVTSFQFFNEGIKDDCEEAQASKRTKLDKEKSLDDESKPDEEIIVENEDSLDSFLFNETLDVVLDDFSSSSELNSLDTPKAIPMNMEQNCQQISFDSLFARQLKKQEPWVQDTQFYKGNGPLFASTGQM
jgi:hypothetical protein